jgi:hypothetical protein
MNNRRACLAVLSLILFGMPAWAEDISGKWVGQYVDYDYEGSKGETTFVFKQGGGKLTGTVTMDSGEQFAIQEGTVNGDAIQFSISRKVGPRTVKLTYSGTATKTDIKFKVDFAGAVHPMYVITKKTS